MSHHDAVSMFRALFSTGEPPELGPGPRPGVLGRQKLNQEVDAILRDLDLKPSEAELSRALVLLWHDHLDAAHSIAQRVENPDGAYLHGMMHRREPDYWNAKYWFRRAGRHRINPALACRAHGLLDAADEPGLRGKVVPGGEWDPFAFVDACEGAEKLEKSHPMRQALRGIQAAEFALLMDYFLGLKG